MQTALVNAGGCNLRSWNTSRRHSHASSCAWGYPLRSHHLLDSLRAEYRNSNSYVTGSTGEGNCPPVLCAATSGFLFNLSARLLHHPGYRSKFADNLKRELPRIPFAPPLPHGRGSDVSEPRASASGFWAFADAGRELARLHLDYEKLEPWPLEFIENPDEPLSYRVEKMKLTKDKKSIIVNPSLTLRALPAECFEYRLGNRSALEWVIDQYQVKEDKRSGILSDPNRADDEQYIVRLVGQVVRVSVETVRIVKGLPAAYACMGEG